MYTVMPCGVQFSMTCMNASPSQPAKPANNNSHDGLKSFYRPGVTPKRSRVKGQLLRGRAINFLKLPDLMLMESFF